MTPFTTGRPATAWTIAAVTWSLVFAAPHFYWAGGGRAGLGGQATAADAALQQGWFAAYNLVAGCLGVAGAVVATVLASAKGGGRGRRLLLLASTVASAVLLLRGTLGVILLGIGALDGAPAEPTPTVLLVIEPWFFLGGLVFAGMVLSQRRRPATARG